MLKYWVWLSELKGLRNQTKLALLRRFGDPESIFYADPDELSLTEGADLSQLKLLENHELAQADRILADCQRLDIGLLTFSDAAYPGRLKNIYDPPVLRDILSVTYGCIVYQEQVMQICREVAGYSLGRADIVRRAMAKKKTAVMAQEREYFIHGLRDETGTVLCEGAVARGISEQTAAHLFDQMASFAKYAFNKSHAVAYAYISYRTAYLKCHYPAQYLCALLTSVLGSTEKMAEYIADAASMGIALLAPDINESGRFFTVSQSDGRPAIRFGLCAIKNVGETFVQKVLAERREAPFDSFEDFVRRMSTAELNKRQVEALIKAGAFDGMRHKRAQLMASYEVIIDKYMQQRRSILSGQIDLFSLESAEQGETRPKTMAYEYPDIPEMSLRQKLLQEREVTGQCFSGHLLDEYSLHIAALRPASVLEICRSFAEEDMQEEAYRPFTDKQRVTVCGVLVALTLKQTRKEETMAFATLEDRYGQIELVIFPATLRACRQYLQQDVAVCAVGEISVREEEAPKLLIREITPLYNNVDFQRNKQNTVPRPAAEARKPQTLYLRLPDLSDCRLWILQDLTFFKRQRCKPSFVKFLRQPQTAGFTTCLRISLAFQIAAQILLHQIHKLQRPCRLDQRYACLQKTACVLTAQLYRVIEFPQSIAMRILTAGCEMIAAERFQRQQDRRYSFLVFEI